MNRARTIIGIVVMCLSNPAVAYNPYVELPLDTKFATDRGISITYDRMRDFIRFLIVATTPDKKAIEPGLNGIRLEAGPPYDVNSGTTSAVVSRWLFVDGTCTAFFTVPEGHLGECRVYLDTPAGSYVTGLTRIVEDNRFEAVSGVQLEKTLERMYRVK